MSWNGQQQQQPRKIPEPGKGRLRKTREIKRRPDGSQISPDFNGLINHEGQILSVSLWFEPAKAAPNGAPMSESWSVRVSRYDPNQQQPAQQQMPYGAQQGVPPQQQGYPQQGYAPPPQSYAPPAQGYAPPPQQGGYAPAPGYQPPPPAQPPQPPQWGGAPAQGRPPQAQAGGFTKADIPF